MNEPLHIALAFDEAYAPHGGATIASILENTGPGEPVFIHVLDSGVSASWRQRLQQLALAKGAQMEFVKVDLTRFSAFPTTHHAAPAYARLALPELLPQLDRVLYVDSDLVVLKSLQPLWNTELKGLAAAVVRDAADVFGSCFLDHKQRLGLARSQPAFNSGVMLLNLAVWRRDALGAVVARWIERNSHLMVHSDQDALNAVLKDQVLFLEPIWNVQTPLIWAVRYGVIRNQEWLLAARDPAVIHYTTSRKPWDCAHAVPRRKDYLRYARVVAAGGGRRFCLPGVAQSVQRVREELLEFKHWLAALLKGRLRSLS